MSHQNEITTSGSYTLAVADMSCEHCLQAVETAALSVDGVTEARVDLDRGVVQVSGGKPHAVIEAIVQAGYEARPKPQIPESCEIPDSEAGTHETADPTADEPEYQVRVTDMSCSACVANVEKAILSVDGVTEAAVNLIAKEFESDTTLFEQLNSDFAAFFSKEERGAEIAEDRTTQVVRGKEQLKVAKMK